MKIPSRFMIIDDDPTNNLICLHAIRRHIGDTDIKLFEEPEVALDSIKEEYSQANIPTVLFLDINMPAMTAWEFLEVFKDFSADIHKQFTIYILSSSVNQRDKEKAETDPFVLDFFSKPLTIECLAKIFPSADSDQLEHSHLNSLTK